MLATILSIPAIQPVTFSDFAAKISSALVLLIEFLSGIAPGFFLLIFIFGTIVGGLGLLLGLRGMRGAGFGAVLLSLAGYLLVVSAPLILGLLKGMVAPN